MDTATLLVYRHAHAIRALIVLAAVAWCAAVLLGLVVQLLVAESSGPTPEVLRLAPFRWDDRHTVPVG